MIAAAFHAWILWAIAGVAFAGWRLDVEINPFAPCRQCGGTGRGRFSRRTAFNVCRHGQTRTRVFAKGAAARHDRRRGR